jgi:hypothetical protein
MHEEVSKTFTVTYPNGEKCEYRERDLMPGFDETYNEEGCTEEVKNEQS